jgi:hypothetical protein
MQRKLAALEKQMSDPRRHSVIAKLGNTGRVMLGLSSDNTDSSYTRDFIMTNPCQGNCLVQC